MYHWRFTTEIAEKFIPRLANAGYLKKIITGTDTAYGVTFPVEKASSEADGIKILFESIIDEFAAFHLVVDDLLQYTKNREELADILIRFLVSSNSFGNESGTYQTKSKSDNDPIDKLEEGGRPLTDDERYLAARFVQYIIAKSPEFAQHLSRLASIGLLTEVVDDFVRPLTPAEKVDLTIVLDATLALNYLGLSGHDTQLDTRTVFDELAKIGCKLVVFSVTCEEISRNLNALLALPKSRRYGPTNSAIAKGEVLEDFARAVAARPENALAKIGIQIREMGLDSFPNLHKYFSKEVYEDFFSTIQWVREVSPREHDATCMALLMRLREGKHSQDIFKCRYVFATRNNTFARVSRRYCLANQSIKENHEGPVVHQRELATIAWLRTGLSSAEIIPRMSLVATCDRMLRVRPEVTDAIRKKIREFAPDKTEQFELLMLDYRSVRKIGDATLNDENVVSDENAVQLLELMRKATKEEAEKEYTEALEAKEKAHKAAQQKSKTQFQEKLTERDRHLAELSEQKSILEGLEQTERQKSKIVIDHMILAVNRKSKRFRKIATFSLIAIGVISVTNMKFGFIASTEWLSGFFVLVGAIGAYHMVADLLQIPKFGLRNATNILARFYLQKELRLRGIEWLSKSDFDIVDGQLSLKQLAKQTAAS